MRLVTLYMTMTHYVCRADFFFFFAFSVLLPLVLRWEKFSLTSAAAS